MQAPEWESCGPCQHGRPNVDPGAGESAARLRPGGVRNHRGSRIVRRPTAITTPVGTSRPAEPGRYSADDLVRIERILTLVATGVNIVGIGRILELEDDNAALRAAAGRVRG